MPRETAAHAYTIAHAEAMVLLDTIRQQLQDLPAPDTTTINWGHVGTVTHVTYALEQILKFLTPSQE